MRKLVIFFLITLGFLVYSPKQVAAADISCEWSLDKEDVLRFCAGGFETKNEIKDYFARVYCSDDCSYDWWIKNSSTKLAKELKKIFAGNGDEVYFDKSIKNEATDIGVNPDGTFFTCISPEGGKFDSSVVKVHNDCVNAGNKPEDCVPEFTGEIRLPTKVVKGSSLACSQVLSADTFDGYNKYAVDTLQNAVLSEFTICSQIGDNQTAKDECAKCVSDPLNPQGLWTAIGCVPLSSGGIISAIIQAALGVGGGITLLLILSGAFRLSVSAGDPKQAEEAKDQITSAVIGLIFIIFSVTILRFIGVNLLQIPGFGG